MVRIASTLDSDDVRVKSPYEDIRDLILVETDLVVKYNNLSLFIQKYCRDAIGDENKYWYYCQETNVQLLPTFYSTLAEGFQFNNYKNALDIVKKIGENYQTMVTKLLMNIVVM